MPVPVFSCIFIFDAEGIGQDGFTVAFAQVFVVQGFDILEDMFDFRRIHSIRRSPLP